MVGYVWFGLVWFGRFDLEGLDQYFKLGQVWFLFCLVGLVSYVWFLIICKFCSCTFCIFFMFSITCTFYYFAYSAHSAYFTTWQFGVHTVWVHNLRLYNAHNEYVHITFLINDHTFNCSYLISISYFSLMKHKSYKLLLKQYSFSSYGFYNSFKH